MNVVDSSAWLEYFADGPNADEFAPAIEAPHELLVPAITLFEVFKRVAQQRDEGAALQCVAVMQQGRIVELDAALALRAAALGLRHKLPLADSIIYATAQAGSATVWTQDADFEGLPGVQFRAKRPAA
ncbi:type II toxin-antitoxin system VapC family toxin [Thauera sp.]|uniref:type II toxin-antitoxin system VapC family toxin n=1 Tax=Thauera sp. TaxID=1905334 RepID=UPI0039E3BEFF